MSNYRNANLLYKPALSVWTARKKDKSESVKVNSAAGAVDGAANVYKQLLPDSPELAAVTKWATGFRSWIYDTTLPWDDSGWRIGRVIRHMEFMAEAGDRIAMGEQLAETFYEAYARAVEEAKFKLNGMFDQTDYPTVDEVRRKFSFTVDVMAMPNSEDFRVVDGVEQAEVDRLVQVATSSTEARIAAAMAEAHERVVEVVVKMANTLTEFGNKQIKKFNNTLITNISDLCAIMPALNLTDDPRLKEITRRAARLATYDVSDLRENAETRAAAINEARGLVAFADNQPGFKSRTFATEATKEMLELAKPLLVKQDPVVVPAAEWPFPGDKNGGMYSAPVSNVAELAQGAAEVTMGAVFEEAEPEAVAASTPAALDAAMFVDWGDE